MRVASHPGRLVLGNIAARILPERSIAAYHHVYAGARHTLASDAPQALDVVRAFVCPEPRAAEAAG